MMLTLLTLFSMVLVFTINIGEEAIEFKPPSTLKLSPHMLTCLNGSYMSMSKEEFSCLKEFVTSKLGKSIDERPL